MSDATTVLYQYFSSPLGGHSPVHVSVAPAAVVQAHFTTEELSKQFGGYAKYRDDKSGDDWIGIWGARKSSKFRRLLKERGVILEVVKAQSPKLRWMASFTH